MNEHFYNASPTDRSKRPRLEDEADPGYEHHGKEDRHPKRQAVPDPETKAPHFAGDEKKRQRTISIRSETDHAYSDDHNSMKNNDVSLSLRALVGTKDAGLIIGRGGKNVNEIRDHSSARVTISDNIAGAHERILTVIGPVQAVAKVRGWWHSHTREANIYITRLIRWWGKRSWLKHLFLTISRNNTNRH